MEKRREKDNAEKPSAQRLAEKARIIP